MRRIYAHGSYNLMLYDGALGSAFRVYNDPEGPWVSVDFVHNMGVEINVMVKDLPHLEEMLSTLAEAYNALKSTIAENELQSQIDEMVEVQVEQALLDKHEKQEKDEF